MAFSEALLKTLYAAPAKPERWGEVLDSCIAMVGADSGWVCELDRCDRLAGSGIVRNMDSSTQDRYFAHYAAIDFFRHDAAGAPDPGLGLWSDERFIAKSELVQSEFYADFMTPIGVHSILIIRMFDDGHVTRSMHLNYGRRGDWSTSAGWRDLKGMFAHLQRAAALSREIGRLSARELALGSALEASAGCVILLDRRGRVCFATEAGAALLQRGDCLVYRQGQVRTAREADASELQRLVALSIDRSSRHRSGGSVHLAVAGRDLPFIVTVAPLELMPVGDNEPIAIVIVRDPAASISASERELAKRFGLTPAERRIALMLAAGSSPRQIAEAVGVTYNTVRNHSKKIYDKTGVRRQSELVASLLRLALSATK